MIFFLETIHEHALAIDFAMFVIIWIVQVIVYPSFLFLEPKSFQLWHTCYCGRISYFVLPLMIEHWSRSVLVFSGTESGGSITEYFWLGWSPFYIPHLFTKNCL